MTPSPAVREALDALKEAHRDLFDRGWDPEKVESALLAAHKADVLAELANQPEAETMRQTVEAVCADPKYPDLSVEPCDCPEDCAARPSCGPCETREWRADVRRYLEAAAPLLTAPWAAKCAALEAELREAHKVIADNIAEYQSALAAHDREKRKAWDELRTATDELDHIDQSLIGAKCRFDGDPETDILKRNIAERVAAVCECLPAAEAEVATLTGKLAEAERERERLAKWIDHDRRCEKGLRGDYPGDPKQPCTCGLDAALECERTPGHHNCAALRLDAQTAELEALWAKVERWQKTAALRADNPSYSPETRALLAFRRTPNNSTGGCPKCAGQAACWCPPETPDE